MLIPSYPMSGNQRQRRDSTCRTAGQQISKIALIEISAELLLRRIPLDWVWQKGWRTAWEAEDI